MGDKKEQKKTGGLGNRCRLCFSPYRDEVVAVWKRGLLRRRIYERYSPLMKYKGNENSFRIMMSKHLKYHKGLEDMIIPTGAGNLKHTMETIAEKFTDLLGEKVQNMKPEDVTVKDYVGVQKVVTDARKLKLTEGAMLLQLGKLFGPPMVEGEMLDVGESQSSERIESHGIRPNQDSAGK